MGLNFETENIEFKEGFTEEIYKEVIAFANTNGGVLYIGIADDGQVVGLSNVDDEYTRITNGIRDAIAPDVTMFVKYHIQENKVVQIEIGEGTNKPYYLKKRGLKSSGVYIRQGTSSVQASNDMIRLMIKENDGDSFEEFRSLKQELTFQEAKQNFQKYKVDFSKEKYAALGLLDKKNEQYTNLALLLSDQCEHTIKVAVFKDEEKIEFQDSKEFSGSIFRQLDNAYQYLALNNRTAATIHGLERVEKEDYPEEAVREALLNAIVHRDYSFSGSIIINITSEEMEFISLGGLVSGLKEEDIRNGVSQPRNKHLADIFYRLRLIESYGTGIRRIYHQYADCLEKPRIEVTQNSFRLILPNKNVHENVSEVNIRSSALTEQQNAVLTYINNNGYITEKVVMDIFSVKKTRAYTILKKLCDLKIIYAEGRGSNKKYYNVQKEGN